MNSYIKSLFVLFFCFFAFSLSAQTGPVTTGSDGDYCECLEGIQSEEDYCPPLPCSPPPPPSGGNTSSGGITGSPSGGSSGGGGTSFNEFFTMMMEMFCEANPSLCD